MSGGQLGLFSEAKFQPPKPTEQERKVQVREHTRTVKPASQRKARKRKPGPAADDWRAQYEAWRVTPHGRKAFEMFERFTLEAAQRARPFGIGLIAERVRWETFFIVEMEPGDFKINNNYRAYIARELIEKHPQLKGLIKTRKTRF